MKTNKVIPQILVASALAFGTACSTANTGASTGGTTSGSSTDTSTGMDATSGTTSATQTQSTGTSTTDPNAGTAGTINAPNANAALNTAGSTSGATGTTNATGAGGATDMNMFMSSFATMEDPAFLMTAASSNMLEIQLGKLAVQKSTNADVKKFGQMMVDHHTKATQELKTVATPLGVTLPQTMMPIHQAMADKLMDKSGKAFDEGYMDAMETAHKMDIAMFEVKSGAAKTPTVKSFATKTLPMLRSHQTMADNMEKKVD